MSIRCENEYKNGLISKLNARFYTHLPAVLNCYKIFMQRFSFRSVFASGTDYIIPIPAPPAGIAGVSSLIVDTTDSVVRSVDATLVAF